jgi:hypothetical protein
MLGGLKADAMLGSRFDGGRAGIALVDLGDLD